MLVLHLKSHSQASKLAWLRFQSLNPLWNFNTRTRTTNTHSTTTTCILRPACLRRRKWEEETSYCSLFFQVIMNINLHKLVFPASACSSWTKTRIIPLTDVHPHLDRCCDVKLLLCLLFRSIKNDVVFVGPFMSWCVVARGVSMATQHLWRRRCTEMLWQVLPL